MGATTFLRGMPVFSSLSELQAVTLSTQFRARQFPPGATIVRRTDPGDAMYVIQRGEVRVPVIAEFGREKFVARLGPGDLFGEMALLTGEPRTADVYAETEVDALVIERAPLDSFLRRFPKLASFLTDILGKRLLEDDAIRYVGKYKLIGELGRGGMSIVYEGLHPSLSKTVAIKMLSHELVYESDFSARFRNEAKIIAALEHENIVQVYDQEEAFATYFIIMEKIKGTVLSRLLETRGVLPFEQVRSILRQMASALDYAHEHGIVHRDVKPANAIIEPGGRVKLMDFGIAKSTVEGDKEEDLIGTAEYMSPEHILQLGVDGRTDIYSLGVMGWEMLIGRVPFECPTSTDILRRQIEEPVPSPRTLRPEIPADLDEFVTHATQKDPDHRFANCGEVVELLSREESRASLKVDDAKVKVLTLVYDAATEEIVRQLVDKVTAATLTIPGMRFGVSDARMV